eukprot:m.118351 g.118351  ORF g.118351 m.118351 type:complete len:55 (-) comp13232_c0_seq3:3492-3656(-)
MSLLQGPISFTEIYSTDHSAMASSEIATPSTEKKGVVDSTSRSVTAGSHVLSAR